MNGLIEDVMMELNGRINDKDLKTVKMVMCMVLDKYDVTKKSTEIVKYEGEETELYLKRFLVSKRIKGCTDRTIEAYGKTLNFIFEKIGKSVMEITTDDIRYYLAVRQIRDKVKDTTASNELRYLKTFFNWMRVEEIRRNDPTEKIERIKVEKTKKEAFKEIEIIKMREACTSNKQRATIDLLLSTGCRIEELVNIKIKDIEGNRILVYGKGKKERYVYINAQASVSLENYLKERTDKSEWLFPGYKYGPGEEGYKKICKIKRNERAMWYVHPEFVSTEKHEDKCSQEATVRKIGRKVGVRAHPHKFRRTCATFALRRGMPIEQVSKMLGHESIETTQIYLDLTEEDLAMAHRKYVI